MQQHRDHGHNSCVYQQIDILDTEQEDGVELLQEAGIMLWLDSICRVNEQFSLLHPL